MKKICILLFTLLAFLSGNAQDITGDWYGLLNIPGLQLRLVFHITKSDNGYTATLDSPNQNANGIPVTSTLLEGNVLKMTVANLLIEYTGTVKNDSIAGGVFKQRGQPFPMDLSRNPIAKNVAVRPQEPAKPYPYHEEEVTFNNTAADVTLAGTLTLPKKGGQIPGGNPHHRKRPSKQG